MFNRPHLYIVSAFMFILGALASFLFFNVLLQKSAAQSQSPYQFINPSSSDKPLDTPWDIEFASLEKKLNDLVEKQKKEDGSTQISVYFRNLNNGAWVGVDSQEAFSPASLLKVPLAITILKAAEKDKTLLNRKLMYTEKQKAQADEASPLFPPPRQLEVNKEYSVDELLTYLLEYSDNGAWQLLLENVSADAYRQTYIDMGLTVPVLNDYLSVKNYSSILRILYNASYLNQEMSEKLLEHLTRTDFDGIPHYLPDSLQVAHKFGERKLDQKIIQLHDCGIVYYPNNPYVLCVMTRGLNIDSLLHIIQTVSQQTYEEMKTRFPENKE